MIFHKTLTFIAIAAAATVAAYGRTGHNAVSASTPGHRSVTVTALTPNILRVTNTGLGETAVVTPATVLTDAKASVASTGNVGPEVSTLTTSAGVSALIDGRTGVLTITAGPGKTITDSGERPAGDGKYEIALYTTSDGSFYGTGERGHALNLRNDSLVMFNRQNYGYTGSDPRISQMNITMPLVLSSDGYALLFDDFAPATLIPGNPVKYITENPGPVSYYFVNGASTLADVTEQLTLLTGRQDLPPFWSLGYITSKYGYRDSEQTLNVVDSLKSAGYPLDGIVLDLYWYGKEQDMGRLEWDPEQWPDPSGMLSTLKNKGVNLVAISQPYILRNGRGIDNYEFLKQNNMLLKDSLGNDQEVTIWVGEGGMFDVSNPDTRAWLRERYKTLTDGGITGWWGDLGEPEVHPLTGLHHNGLTAAQYHNLYGNDWSSIIYDLFKEEYPDTRLMTLMRGGTTGLQRYSVFPWSTDVSRSWGGLEPQVRIMLQSGLSGLGYMGHDVGGFAVEPGKEYQPELYVRWLQLGLFSPVLRIHAQQYAEPYLYPQYAHIIEPLVKERYRWLPYNYTLAWENASKGWPLVRPLNFTDPDHTFDHISDEFLWGNNVLVAPVMKEGATSRDVTFPAGKWVAMNAPCRVYEGYTTVKDYPAPLTDIPLFVKAGAFIPMADYEMENTGDYDPSRLTVNYYPVAGESSSHVMFDDDRSSTGTIAAGQRRLITFNGSAGGSRIKVSAQGSYRNAPSTVSLTFVIHRAAAPATFRINGRNVKAKYDADAHTLTFSVKWPVDRQLVIDSNNLTLCSQE